MYKIQIENLNLYKIFFMFVQNYNNMKKIFLSFAVLLSFFAYSQFNPNQMHRQIASQQRQFEAFNRSQLDRTMELSRSSSTSISTASLLAKTEKDINKLNARLQREEAKLQELKTDSLKNEKKIEKSTEKIEKIKSQLVSKNDLASGYRDRIESDRKALEEKKAKREEKKEERQEESAKKKEEKQAQ